MIQLSYFRKSQCTNVIAGLFFKFCLYLVDFICLCESFTGRIQMKSDVAIWEVVVVSLFICVYPVPRYGGGMGSSFWEGTPPIRTGQ